MVYSEPGVYQYTDSNSGMNGTFTVNAPASQGVIEATITNLNTTGGVTLLKNYPNPFKYNTTIAYGINSNEGEIQITDGLGRTIAKYPINNSSGEIIVKEALNSGVYFYSLWDGRKLVKREKMQVLR